MTQETLTKILAGANKIARQSTESIKESGANYIEENIIKGKYVTREEYEQLNKLVVKLQNELADLKSENNK